MRQGSAERNKVQEYCDPNKTQDQIKTSKAPTQPILQKYKKASTKPVEPIATESVADLNNDQFQRYLCEREEYTQELAKHKKKKKAPAALVTEISRTGNKRHINLLKKKCIAYKRLVTPKNHFARADCKVQTATVSKKS